MKIIPIAFCFDDNLELPACVCISSLLEHANHDTYYDIFILHEDRASFVNGKLNDLHQFYHNFKLNFRSVGNEFDGAFEIRGITKAAYYRLLIPELIPEYDKIFYFDVDIIFRDDLSSIYEQTNLDGYYVGGVATPYSDITPYVQNIIQMPIDEYICSGTLILNSKMILRDNLIPKFKSVAIKKWKYQDQDTLNLVCKGKIKLMPPSFGIVGTVSEILSNKHQSYYSEKEVEYALNNGIIHYNGAKPWNGWCLNFDIWWESYRKSIYFDAEYYLSFYSKKLNEYDELSLWKRVKILLRYFKKAIGI